LPIMSKAVATWRRPVVEAAGQAERVKVENYLPDLCGLTPSLNN